MTVLNRIISQKSLDFYRDIYLWETPKGGGAVQLVDLGKIIYVKNFLTLNAATAFYNLEISKRKLK